ncbi:MAG: low molecular weight protein-tyrosine-phosphatase [Bacteroidales bacterium]
MNNIINSNKKPIKVLFVCLGNICRSPSAHGIMEHLLLSNGWDDDILVDSAGTYSGHAGSLPDSRMRKAAIARGYTLTHRSRGVRSVDFEEFDIIIGMDNENIRNLKAMANNCEEMDKIIPMAKFISNNPNYDYIPDPYYEGREGFELVLDLLENACGNLLECIKKNTVFK